MFRELRRTNLGGALDHVPSVVVVVLTAILLCWLSGPLTPDVSGQILIAHAMRGGARLYLDIVEINPPLWFWLAMPLDWLAATLGVRAEAVTIVVTGVAVLAAIRACARLMPGPASVGRALFLSYVATILLVLPAQQLEQREHLALIGAIPYLTLAAARRGGAIVPPWLALLVGLAAALGFALKPHFLLVPILIELWLVAALRRQWRPLRAETLALAVTGLTYGVAILLVTPLFFTSTVRLLFPIYQSVGGTLFEMVNVVMAIWLLALACIIVQRVARRGTPVPLTTALVVGAAGFALAWLIQHKGWLYQGMPVTGCLAIALAAVLFETGRGANAFVRVLSPLLLAVPMLFAFNEAETRIPPRYDLAPAFADLRPGDPIGLISTRGITTWPALVDRGFRQSGRHFQFWMLDAVDQRPHDPAARALLMRSVHETAFDYRCLPPRVIVFRRMTRDPANRRVANDPYPLFARDPLFAAVLSHYRLWRTGPTYDAWRPVSRPDPVDPSQCRRPG